MEVPVYLQNHRVFWAVKRAHEAFAIRLEQIDSELAQLSLVRETLARRMASMKDCDHTPSVLALCMSQHQRLGCDSKIAKLPQELIQLISEQIDI